MVYPNHAVKSPSRGLRALTIRARGRPAPATRPCAADSTAPPLVGSVGTGPARVTTCADEIRPSSAHAQSATRRRGLGRVARAWRALPAAASWSQGYTYAQLLRRVLVHRRGRKTVQLDVHRPPLALALKLLLRQHRRPRGALLVACPSPCNTFYLQALVTPHWRVLSLSSWRDAPASRRPLSDGCCAIAGAVDQRDCRLARLFFLPRLVRMYEYITNITNHYLAAP